MEKMMTHSMTVTIQLSNGERKVTKKNVVKIIMLERD